MATNAPCYTIVHDDLLDSPSTNDLRNALQKGSDEVKLETMRTIIVGTLNGQSYVRVSCTCWAASNTPIGVPSHAHHSIRNALSKQAAQEDAAFLLGVSRVRRSKCRGVLTVFRVCPKLDENGKLKQEMILVV